MRSSLQNKAKMYELIDRIDWLSIEPKIRGNKMKPDELHIGFQPSKKKNNGVIDRVRVKFGIDIIREMGWENGDNIGVFHDPDNLLSFLFAKVDNKGFKLYREKTNPKIYSIQFRWDRPLKLEERKSAPVQYHIMKNRIAVFHVGSQEEYYDKE